jgi:transmembrane sensor
LDSAANGDVARQGNTKIVKSESGRLAYQPGNMQAAAGKNTTPADEASYNTISTPRGGQYQIVLPDGSRVWLNAASSIRFPTQFTRPDRSVEITGEAYMEIAKNARQSFSVKVNGIGIQVLGTSFNVNAYEDEPAIKTTVIEGSVRVKTPEKAAVLHPGQQAEIRQQTLKVANNVDLDKVIAWKNGLFNFNGAGVGDVMRQLSRWYDIDVVYDKKIPDIEFVGKMSRRVSLSGVLKGLEGAGMHFHIENGKRLIILP